MKVRQGAPKSILVVRKVEHLRARTAQEWWRRIQIEQELSLIRPCSTSRDPCFVKCCFATCRWGTESDESGSSQNSSRRSSFFQLWRGKWRLYGCYWQYEAARWLFWMSWTILLWDEGRYKLDCRLPDKKAIWDQYVCWVQTLKLQPTPEKLCSEADLRVKIFGFACLFSVNWHGFRWDHRRTYWWV